MRSFAVWPSSTRCSAGSSNSSGSTHSDSEPSGGGAEREYIVPAAARRDRIISTCGGEHPPGFEPVTKPDRDDFGTSESPHGSRHPLELVSGTCFGGTESWPPATVGHPLSFPSAHSLPS